jgi:hypothetical protein
MVTEGTGTQQRELFPVSIYHPSIHHGAVVGLLVHSLLASSFFSTQHG